MLYITLLLLQSLRIFGWFKHYIDIQTSKELIQMGINKVMTSGILTVNGEHTQSKTNIQQI